MSQTRVDWGSIAGLVRTLEIRRGPFWEPSRTRGAMEPADVLAIGDELECLLERLAVGRRKSVVLLGVMLILCLGLFAGLALVATRLSDWVATVGSLAVGVAIVVLALVYWRDWLIALYGAYTLPPAPPAPKPDELVAAMRRLCDGFAVLSDETAAVTLRKMKSSAPLPLRPACIPPWSAPGFNEEYALPNKRIERTAQGRIHPSGLDRRSYARR